MKHSLFLSYCLAVCASGVFPVMAQTFSNGLPAKQIVLSQKAREALKGKQILYIEREIITIRQLYFSRVRLMRRVLLRVERCVYMMWIRVESEH